MIERIECFVLVHEMKRAQGPSILDYRERSAALVKITDSSGAAGWSESYLAPGVVATIEELGTLYLGRDPLHARRLWGEAWFGSHDNLAVSGLSNALDDLRGRLLGVPITSLYGGAVRDRARAYASSGGYYGETDPADTWPSEMDQHLAEGFTAIKLRIGRWPIDHEVRLIEGLRARLPEGFDLMADGNAAYTLPEAIRMGHALGRLGFRWYEEPMPQADYAGYERLHAAVDVALAGGEGLRDRGEARAFLDRTPVDVVQPDVAICGGLAEMQFICDLARLHAIQFVPHAWGGALMLAATLHAVGVTPDPNRSPIALAPLLEVDRTENPFLTDVLATPLVMRDGWYDIPTGPGLGVEVNEAYVRERARQTRVVAT